MSHIPVSVIIAAGGSSDDLHGCLETLRPTLGLRDEVVCVVPANREDLQAELRGRTWLKILIDETGDPAQRWTAGLAATRHPIIVLLDGDVILSTHWLDTVAQPFNDPAVVASGPRCHHSFGPQQADLPDHAIESIAAFKAYAREWRAEHRAMVTDVDRLGPVCVAMRRDALALAGGPTLDLPYPQLADQGRIVLTHSALVAHVASVECELRRYEPHSAVRLSASLIVKDEEDVLPSCLAALQDLVDEIVVYDTGSTDRTREIAADYGARVIEGYWDDNFGEARSRSLAHCHGEWVLWVDADEVAVGDPTAVRAAIEAADRHAFMIKIISQEGHAGNLGTTAHMYPRLFRRARARITGRLHEQVTDRILGRSLAGPELRQLVLDHSGYTPLRTIVKGKGARNLRLAELAAEDADGLQTMANLARSQLGIRHYDEAIETCRRGLAIAVHQHHKVTLLKSLIDALVGANRLDEAEEQLAVLRDTVKIQLTADEHELRLRFAQRDDERVLELVNAMPESATNDLLFNVRRDNYTRYAIDSLSRLGRHQEAADMLRDSLRRGHVPAPLARMSVLLTAAGAAIADIASIVNRRSLRGLLFNVSEAPTPLADELLEALWAQFPGEPTVLAVAARVGRRLPLLRAMEWSSRLRQHGFGDECTLLAVAQDPARTPRERSLATAIALELFDDQAALPLLVQALETVPEHESTAVLEEIRLLAPGVAMNIELANA